MENLESERQKTEPRKVFDIITGSCGPSVEKYDKKSPKISEIFLKRTNVKELSPDEIMEILVVSPLPETAAVNFLDSKFFIWRVISKITQYVKIILEDSFRRCV